MSELAALRDDIRGLRAELKELSALVTEARLGMARSEGQASDLKAVQETVERVRLAQEHQKGAVLGVGKAGAVALSLPGLVALFRSFF